MEEYDVENGMGYMSKLHKVSKGKQSKQHQGKRHHAGQDEKHGLVERS
jgi:hypothetical protein